MPTNAQWHEHSHLVVSNHSGAGTLMILGTLCNEKGVGDRRTGTPVARVPNKMGRLGAPRVAAYFTRLLP